MRRYFSSRCLLVLCAAFLPVFSISAADSLSLMVFPRRDAATTTKLFTPLAQYLSKQLNTSVALITASDFSEFMSVLAKGNVDIVHLNQYQYIELNKTQGYRVIAQNEEFGQKDIAGAIYVREDSNIHQLSELKGKTVIFGGDQTAMISYIVPTFLMLRAGLKEGEYHEKMAISPPNAVIAMILGHADAVGAADIAPKLKIIKQRGGDKMKKIAESVRVAHLPWAVKGDLPDTLVLKIQTLLSSLKETEEGRSVLKAARLTSINRAIDSDYNTHRQIIDTVFEKH